jgi:hypothetical protein
MRILSRTAGGLAVLVICGWIGAGCVGTSPPASSNGNSATGNGGGSARGGAEATPRGRRSDAQRRFPLDSLRTATLRINDHEFRAWLALTGEQHTEGLMFVPEDEIRDDQGMLFVFNNEEPRSFWMRNTITSLDIAFARSDGRIVKIWTMPPLTLNSFPSVEPAMFALEVKSGTFQRLSVREGDRIEIPEDALRP